jgi:7-keto-8-aminopelargonate synthetase-like enzyme
VAKTKSFYSRGRKIQTTNRFFTEAQATGLIMQRAGSGDGREWLIGDSALRNFGSCSYVGLERHPALMAGAEAALRQFGTNFSISRAYLQCPLYDALETALSRAMDRPVLVTPSTTLAHLAALPVLIGDRDLVLVDQFAHASMHMATDLITDVPIELLQHNRLDALEKRLIEAQQHYERIWYLCDGVYSMLGDFAPFAGLTDLMRRYPQLHLYVDDAHAMSWTGTHGRGAALTHLGELDRVSVAVSLSKAFGATGGALALPTCELRDRVRRCGGPMIFSGPIAPAALGAAVASAELHLSPQFADMQAEVLERINFARTALQQHGLETASDHETPIFMLQYDSAPTVFAVVRAMRGRGFYCCPSTFPAVPMNKPSLRFTVSRHNSLADLQGLVETLAEVTRAVTSSSAAPTKRETVTEASPF